MTFDVSRAANLAAIVLFACATNAQEAGTTPDSKTPNTKQGQHYVKVSALLGTKVHAPATLDAKSAPVVGEIKDIIVGTNASSPHGAFAVLSDGELLTIGKTDRYGPSCLRWSVSRNSFDVECQSPPSDVRGEGKADGSRDPSRGTAEASAPRDAAVATPRKPEVPADATAPSRMLMFSGIKGLKVHAEGTKDAVGEVEDLWIDSGHGCAAYMVVSSGGVLGVGETRRLVPFSAARLERSVDQKSNQVNLRAGKTVFEGAPALEGNYEPNDPALRAQSCKVFQCEEIDGRVHPKSPGSDSDPKKR